MKALRVLVVVLLVSGACLVTVLVASAGRPAEWVNSLQERLGMGGSAAPPRPGDPSTGQGQSVARVSTNGLDERARRFYERRDGRPAWFDHTGHPDEAARAMLEAVRRAPEEGLDAADYDVGSIESELAGAKPEQVAALDARMTTVFLRYASDVAEGRVDPRTIHPDWHVPPNDFDVAGLLAGAVDANSVPKLLAELPPPHPEYARLKQALASLRAEAAAPPTPPAQPAVSRARASSARRGGRPALRREERAAGRRPAPAPPPTLPVAERIRRVVLSMERWRWAPRSLGNPCIVINLPTFTLTVREGEHNALQMKIVAGKDWTPTPVFSDAITSLIFNPTWNIPDGIARDEILPAALHNPGSLESKGIHALDGYGERAREVDLASLRDPAPGGKLPVVFRQDPGPENPLGRIKFMMPNKYDIYLHDTPAGHLFAREERAFSHGCIRVEKPVELAAYLLRGADWDESKITAAMDESETREVRLAHSVPVHILYMTAWVGDSGALEIGDDVYDLDRVLEAMLNRSTGDDRAAHRPATPSGPARAKPPEDASR